MEEGKKKNDGLGRRRVNFEEFDDSQPWIFGLEPEPFFFPWVNYLCRYRMIIKNMMALTVCNYSGWIFRNDNMEFYYST
jgi:hypothetical protein